MATKPLSKPTRRSNDIGKEDLHVRISERPTAPETSPGEAGRYVYGIVETKEHLNFGKIGIGGAGEAAYVKRRLRYSIPHGKTPWLTNT